MKPNAFFSKMFLKERFFTIVIREKKNVSIIENKHFSAEYIIPSNRDKWCADPILVDYGDKTYLFYEAVVGDKGHIEVAQVKDDCTIGEPVVVLKDECHYSYPFVFCYKDEWYMIPESSAVDEVRLYRATDFPRKWEICSILLHEKAVDTTVFELEKQLYLLTFVLIGGSERVIPHVYKMKLVGNRTELNEILWRDYDELRVRGAGPLLSIQGKLYRPAQISREQRYGDGIVFYQVNVTDSYEENAIENILETDLLIPGYYVDGLHTYSSSKRFEAIDVRCGELDYFKPIHKVLKLLKSKIGD